MPQMIFVNLPVSDLARSTAFYEALGAVRNPDFSDASTACMAVAETIFVMLLTHERFGQFTSRPIADAKATCQALLCLTAESRAGVDALIAAGGGAGGRVDPNPSQDHGFMYGRSVEDPDGHILEVVWMDVAAAMAAKDAHAAAA